MKKYGMLFAFTVVLGISIIGYGKYVKESIPKVAVSYTHLTLPTIYSV